MIRVYPKPEPATFSGKVGRPGLIALKRFKAGKIKKLPALWGKCAGDLWRAYDGICAYMGMRLAQSSGAQSVDHFRSKVGRPDLAYKWSNYRLGGRLMNSRKREFNDVLDPFLVRHGWFAINLVSGEVEIGKNLSANNKRKVRKTIERLKLNHSKCVSDRNEYIKYYLKGMPFSVLEALFPFLAMELSRQKCRRAND